MLANIVFCKIFINIKYFFRLNLHAFFFISPAEVVILGANTAGEFAARAALGLGAEVKLFDSCMKKLSSVQDVLTCGTFYAFLKQNLHARRGVYMYNGIITHEGVAREHGLTSKSIDLLLAAF